MQKVFGFIPVASFLLVFPLYAGFYSLKPKSVYEKAIIGTILPRVEENVTTELPKDLPVLIGVFMADGIKKAIFYLPKDREKKAVVEEGKEFKGFLLKKVGKDFVVLERGGKDYTITMFSQEAKDTRKRRRKVVYIPPTRRLVEGVEKVPSSSHKVSTSPKPSPMPHIGGEKGSTPTKTKRRAKKTVNKKAKSFIELLRSLSKKAKEGGSAPRENPFLRLFQQRK